MKRFVKLKGMLNQEILRLICDWRIYVSIILFVLVCIAICAEHGTSSSFSAFQYITGLSNISYLLIIISAFPASCIFCDDFLGNYIRPAVSRSGIKEYIVGKILVSYLTTFLITFVGMNMFMIIETVAKGYGNSNIPMYSPYGALANGNIPYMYLFMNALMYSLMVSIYAIYGLAFSALLPNRFVAVMAPLLLNICLEQISYNFPKGLGLYDLGCASAFYKMGDVKNTIFSSMVIIGYCVIGGLIFKWITERRIRNEII